jgi:hypothetical protein
VDEITLFAELKPAPPGETADVQARARARLDRAISPPGRAARPRPRRRRRLVLGLAAVAVAACAATVVPSVLFGGHSGTLSTPAYAITRGAGGTITVSIYDIATAANGAALQRDLRAEGVPALVRVQQSTNQTTCQIPASDFVPIKVARAVVRTEVNGHLLGPDGGAAVVFPAQLTPAERASERRDPYLRFFIHPSAMPAGSVLYIWRDTYPGPGGQPRQQEIGTPEVLWHDRLSC